MPDACPDRAALLAARLAATRARSVALTDGLSAEDMVVQSMPDASPVKWHLAHTTWFFETFVLGPHAGQPPHDPAWAYLFNSYYVAAGERHPRSRRGLVTRPGVAEVLEWRAQVDRRLAAFLETDPAADALDLIDLGIAHEQQHQELLLTDLKHLLAQNPLRHLLRPARPGTEDRASGVPPPLGWVEHPGGLVEVGHAGSGFAYDNEGPRHRVWLEPFALADRPVSCGEWLAFMADGGYATPSLWLSDGWALVQAEGWRAPLYWRDAGDGDWRVFTLSGERRPDPAESVAHVSQYEADAFARWAAGVQAGPGGRLPTEAEWETVAALRAPSGTFADAGRYHPAPLSGPSWYGEVWDWTASAYLPYPGFRTAAGAVGEYNGKFMSGQMVLRGGSCATPAGHVRPTYRNFFPPAARWQFSGLRLAR